MLRRHRLSPAAAARVREIIEAHGVVGAAKRLNSSRETLVRVCAGLGIRRGSAALIERELARLAGHYEPRHRDDFEREPAGGSQ